MIQCPVENPRGFLFVGDPHLSSRTPGLRRDTYAEAILTKLAWCLQTARENQLQPVILGDLFHFPKDNANWLLTELCRLMHSHQPVGIHGNHDCSANELLDDDSLSILHTAGLLPLLDRDGPWVGRMGDVDVLLGGTSWGQRIPRNFNPIDHKLPGETRAVWITHHDLIVSGYEDSGRIRPHEIPGIDIVVNGHLHHGSEPLVTGMTRWLVPGNISRVNHGEASVNFKPQVLVLTLENEQWIESMLEVPHQPFDEVFHKSIEGAPDKATSLSGVVRGLKELIETRTQSGAMLNSFLNENLRELEVDPEICAEIHVLKEEVIGNHG